MRKVHTALWLAGGLLLLISFPARWWDVTLVSGVSIPVTGVELSALATTLVAVSAAAFGAGLLARGIARRVLAALSASAVFGAGTAIIFQSRAPELAVLDVITQFTGVSGPVVLESVAEVSAEVWFVVALLGAGLMVLGGMVGIFAPDRPPTTSRYERKAETPDLGDSVATWDTLSDGVDPTKR